MVTGVSYAGKPLDNTAMYITKKVEHLVNNLLDVSGCKVFVESSVEVPDDIRQKNEIVFTDTPQLDYARFVQELDKERTDAERKRKYTKTDGGYTVGENVKIGEGAYIEPGAFIGHDVIIGDNAYIGTGAVIKNAVIGNNFAVGENCTIGIPAFTITDDEYEKKIRIPALGKVVIKDNVEVGPQSVIQRGSAGNTVIEDNVKIGVLTVIGHDAHLGRNAVIPGVVTVLGFVTVEEGAYIGVNACLRNRIRIGKNAFVGMGAVVTKSVDEGVTVIGNPAKPFKKSK